jgi:flagellar biogenesis protein FliO
MEKSAKHMNRGDQTIIAPAPSLPRLFERLVCFLRKIKVRKRERSLRLCDSLALGEKRFITVVECEHHRFLLGVTSQSISLLHELDGKAPVKVREGNQSGRNVEGACE